MHRRRFLGTLGAAAGAAVGVTTLRGSTEGATATDEFMADQSEQSQIPHQGVHRVIWSIETDVPYACLTFDDGPDPEFTPAVLDLLDRYSVKATFLMMGHNAKAHPRLARQVVEAGHEIGNHTSTHLNLGAQTREITRRQIADGASEIAAATGVRPRWFRPPRGQLSAWSIRYAAIENQDTVMWSLDRGPSGPATPGAVADHVGTAGPGDIVCLHDGLGRGTFNPDEPFTDDLRVRRQIELQAMPRILGDARDRGLQWVTLSELVGTERPAAPDAGLAS